MLNVEKFRLTIELQEDLLGTVPREKKLYSRFVAEKAKEKLENMRKKGIPMTDGSPVTEEAIATLVKEEEETVESITEKGHTGFHKDGEGWFLYNYALKGFLCEAARTLKEGKGEDGKARKKKVKEGETAAEPVGEDSTIKQLQDKVKRYLFVNPRRIRLSEPAGTLERPLRAQTAQGPRVALVKSDFIASGSQISAELHLIKGGGLTRAILCDILSYGRYMGLGQWRSGGYGTFSYSLADLE